MRKNSMLWIFAAVVLALAIGSVLAVTIEDYIELAESIRRDAAGDPEALKELLGILSSKSPINQLPQVQSLRQQLLDSGVESSSSGGMSTITIVGVIALVLAIALIFFGNKMGSKNPVKKADDTTDDFKKENEIIGRLLDLIYRKMLAARQINESVQSWEKDYTKSPEELDRILAGAKEISGINKQLPAAEKELTSAIDKVIQDIKDLDKAHKGEEKEFNELGELAGRHLDSLKAQLDELAAKDKKAEIFYQTIVAILRKKLLEVGKIALSEQKESADKTHEAMIAELLKKKEEINPAVVNLENLKKYAAWQLGYANEQNLSAKAAFDADNYLLPHIQDVGLIARKIDEIIKDLKYEEEKLTKPLEGMEELQKKDEFEVREIQKILTLFAKAILDKVLAERHPEAEQELQQNINSLLSKHRKKINFTWEKGKFSLYWMAFGKDELHGIIHHSAHLEGKAGITDIQVHSHPIRLKASDLENGLHSYLKSLKSHIAEMIRREPNAVALHEEAKAKGLLTEEEIKSLLKNHEGNLAVEKIEKLVSVDKLAEIYNVKGDNGGIKGLKRHVENLHLEVVDGARKAFRERNAELGRKMLQAYRQLGNNLKEALKKTGKVPDHRIDMVYHEITKGISVKINEPHFVDDYSWAKGPLKLGEANVDRNGPLPITNREDEEWSKKQLGFDGRNARKNGPLPISNKEDEGWAKKKLGGLKENINKDKPLPITKRPWLDTK